MQSSATEKVRSIWREALCLPGISDLKESILLELSSYFNMPPDRIGGLCASSLRNSASVWLAHRRTACADVEAFYAECSDYIFEEANLDDPYAHSGSCLSLLEWTGGLTGRQFLDYGSGIGTTALFFHTRGLDVTLADISTPMLDFCRHRFQIREWGASFIELMDQSLPEHAFDLIIAFDVFEHLHDPWMHLVRLVRALKPGGILAIEACFGPDPHRPMHIVVDSRVLDLAPLLGLKLMNCSAFRLFTQPPSLMIFDCTSSYSISHLMETALGLMRYTLKRMKNGRSVRG